MAYYQVSFPLGDEGKIGIASPTEDWNPYIIEAGRHIEINNIPVFVLSEGVYLDYQPCIGLRLCSKDLMTIIDINKSKNDVIKWFKVCVQSEVFGKRNYYIMHFPVIPDVLDNEKTIFAGDDGNFVIRPHFRYEAIKSHNIFTYPGRINSWIVSEQMKYIIEKAKCSGIDFALAKAS